MWKYILIGLALVVIIFLVAVAMQPSEFRVTRTATVSAPSAKVFEQVNELRKWEAWSPWERKDPNMKKTYEGPPAGPGAIFRWAGDKNVGEGNLTITESRLPDFVRVKLQFLKPFPGTSDAEFTFKPEGERTLVTWSMVSGCNLVAKAFHLFVDMDKMLGTDFEKGLAGIKTVLETPAAK